MQRGLPQGEEFLFSLKEIVHTPETPKKGEALTIKGKAELLKIPFFPPVWIIVTVTAPEKWYEHFIPIWGAPETREMVMAVGGDFELSFPKGFDREGEYRLAVRLYPGPTMPIDGITLPPFPAAATEETTFMVSGEQLPEEAGFRDFRIASYSRNGGPPVTPPDVLELGQGDKCRIKVAGEHRGDSVTAEYHAAIWQKTLIDPHDEILNAEKPFSIPASADWEPFEHSIDIPITVDGISPGTEYGLYVKIMGITGGDIRTEYLANVITIIGVPEEEFRDLEIVDYDPEMGIDDTCLVKVQFDYRGPKVTKELYAAIGNYGVFGFDEIIHGSKSIDITPEHPGEWETYGPDVGIPITSGIDPKDSPYDLYAKINGIHPVIESPVLEDVITITEELKGTINKKQLEYNETRRSIPVSSIPYGKRGLVHVWGRNDTSRNKSLGMEWEVVDPDGIAVERHIDDWALGWVSPGEDREFIGGRFDLDKAGTYRIAITMFMNHDNPTEVDSYEGDLCTVKAVEYKGTITKKQLEYNGTRSSIPVSNVSLDSRGLVHIWGRNDMSTTQDLGIHWLVYDPDGYLVEDYSDWSYGHGAGDDHEFIGDRFGLNKAGTYTIELSLFMNPSAPVVVDTYSGRLCTVEAAPPPEYKGTISKKQLEHDGTRDSIPVSGVPLDERGLVHIWGRNDMSTTQDLGIHWLVYDPDGYLVEDYSDWSYGHGAGDEHEFIGGRFGLDKAGTYTIEVGLSMNPSDPVVVDSYSGRLCTVAIARYRLSTRALPSYAGWVRGGGTYDAGTEVTVEAIPEPGFEFDYWGGDLSGRENPTTIIMDRHKSVTAYFYEKPVEEYTLTTDARPSWGGWVLGAGTYSAGERVTVEAVANPGYNFLYWGGDASGTSPTTTVVMDSDKYVIAYFEEKVVEKYKLTTEVYPSGAGYIRPSSGEYDPGTEVTITAYSYSGWDFNYWDGDCSGILSSCTITMNRDKHCRAVFRYKF